jgi:hypothetical protein
MAVMVIMVVMVVMVVLVIMVTKIIMVIMFIEIIIFNMYWTTGGTFRVSGAITWIWSRTHT